MRSQGAGFACVVCVDVLPRPAAEHRGDGDSDLEELALLFPASLSPQHRVWFPLLLL